MCRLLAFGDSLTAGYHDQGSSFTPWAPLLKEELGLKCADHVGFSGWNTSQMREQLDEWAASDVVKHQWPGLRRKLRDAGPYDCVIIMAGTNDLGDRPYPEEIVANLAALHSVCHAAGAKTIAASIPESRAAASMPWYGQLRAHTNELLKQWASSQQGVLFVDTAQLVPFASGPLWEPDGLHMSSEGYRAFGKRLAPLLADWLRPCTSTPHR
mmetsp:Transcript_53100/g.113516  ORF Transcript_53100/g.113516 Transcript_53100/m.113516 type:complete len:212 (-) Transcript_53100:221-856(-)|eukprot:CAMPEP_0183334288 /NCGR_PEP_ID=MMETSP0164_2-20130417/2939_1 /TAXON_ID=221442 /ORGANISM="Coccolithus pelagicus ssp braarudi, Strain PLY182g" /LENGTH=211 /DNA_ID=CAMNT_0025503399 /DNA_START=132 /DNA_END=767 /DNA_ORIENTATION=+